MDKKDFPVLTGLRFMAASAVFLFHYAQTLYPGEHHAYVYFLLRQLNIGVSLFFVLSGFLITHRYYSISFYRQEWRSYMVKRVARIFPLYFLVLFVQLLLLFVHTHTFPDTVTILLSVTLLKGLSATYFYTVLTQSWSLTVEEMFYLYAPLSFYLIKIKRFFWGQLIVLTLLGFLLVWLAGRLGWSGFFGGVEFLFAGTFFGRCFEFFTGMFLALLIKNRPLTRPTKWRTAAGGFSFSGLLLLLGYYAYQGRIEVINDYWPGIVLFNFLLPPAIGLLYYGLLTEESFLKKILSAPPATLLGKGSYAFYLLHIGMIAEIIYFHITSSILLLFVLLQLLSIAAYKLFEKPVYFFLLRKFAVLSEKTA